MNSDLLQRMRDALSAAAGQYGPITDEQRNEWQTLVAEYDSHPGWFVTSTVPEDLPEGDEE